MPIFDPDERRGNRRMATLACVYSVDRYVRKPADIIAALFRDPDILYIAPENAPGPDVDYPTHIDLALEIVSPGSDARTRDYEDKRRDYARAGIAEYWIVDPQVDLVTVLVLQDNNYVEHGVFQIGDEATSVLLPGLRIDVRAMFNA